MAIHRLFLGVLDGALQIVPREWRPVIFVKRYLIHTGGDVIPERVNVLDLFIDWQVVESWRRQRQRACEPIIRRFSES